MKIFIYSINYAPELTGIGKYTGELAEWLYEKGASVKVVTAPPYYPHWKIGNGYSSTKYKFEKIKGVDVWRCPLWIPKNKTGFKRILHLLSFATSSYPIMLREVFRKPDILIVVQPTFFCVPLSLIVAKFSGIKIWLHIQDFEIDAGFKMGFLPRKFLYSLVKHFERLIMKQFDRVSTISSKMLERLANYRIPSKKCMLFPNWVDTEIIFPSSKNNFFRKEWGVNVDTTVVLYSGNMGEKQGLELLIETAKKLLDCDNILFVLCGDGATQKRLVKMADGMKNVRFLNVQPLEYFNQLLNSADIHLLPQRHDTEDLVMPSKLTGILASGGFVITNAKKDSELAKVVLESGGVVCNSEDSSELSKLIKNISNNEGSNYGKKIQARSYAELNLSKEKILKNFYNELKILCKNCM